MDALLGWVDLWRLRVPLVVHAVEYHFSIIVKFRELVSVQKHPILTISNDSHIGFQHLSRVVFPENQIDIMWEAVFSPLLYQHKLLFKLAKNNHTTSLSALFWFFLEHGIYKVHEFSDIEVFVCIKEGFTCFFTLAFGIVA